MRAPVIGFVGGAGCSDGAPGEVTGSGPDGVSPSCQRPGDVWGEFGGLGGEVSSPRPHLPGCSVYGRPPKISPLLWRWAAGRERSPRQQRAEVRAAPGAENGARIRRIWLRGAGKAGGAADRAERGPRVRESGVPAPEATGRRWRGSAGRVGGLGGPGPRGGPPWMRGRAIKTGLGSRPAVEALLVRGWAVGMREARCSLGRSR